MLSRTLPSLIRILLFLLFTERVEAYTVRWFVAELRSFDVTPSCLMTELCRAPVLKTVLQVGGTQLSSSIELNASAVDGVYDRLVSNPVQTLGLDDFAIKNEIVGTDPTFNFHRTCDNSTRQLLLVPSEDSGGDKKLYTFQLRGTCFTALIVVSVHENSCPWCIFEAESIIAEDANTVNVSTTLLFVACIVSTVLAVGLLIACIFVCRLNRRLKSKMRRSESSSHCSPCTQNTESTYDVPWRTYGYRTQRLIRAPNGTTCYRPMMMPAPISGGSSTTTQQTKIVDDSLLRLSPGDYPSTPNQGDRTFGMCLSTAHNGQLGGSDAVAIQLGNGLLYKENHDDSGRDSI